MNKPHFVSVQRAEKRCGINCVYTNADRLTNKFDELQNIIKHDDISLVAVVETLPKDLQYRQIDPNDIKFVLPGYSIIQNNKGRGLCIFIKDGIDYVRQPELELFETSIFIKIKTTNEYVTLGVVYKSPSSNAEQVQSMINQIKFVSDKHNHPNDKLLFLGDFNFPQIDWVDETTPGSDEHPASKFLSVINECYLTQLIDQDTHYKPGTKPSLIDLIITNNDDLIDNIDYFAPIGNSHHLVLSFKLLVDLPCPSPSTTIKYLYNKGNYDAMRADFKDVAWDTIFNEYNDVDTCMLEIENMINLSKDKHIPKKKGSSKKVKRTFNIPETLHSKIKLKRVAFKLYKKYPTPANFKDYVTIRNEVNKETRIAQKNKEVTVAKQAKTNPKALFNYISSKTKPKEAISDLEKPDGTLTENDDEKSQVLCDFFSSVFVKENVDNIPSFEREVENSLSDLTVSDGDMLNILKSLNVNKSPGPDGVHPKLLKELCNELCHPLKLLFDKSMNEGRLPKCWKEAEVRPIFKKGKKSAPGNYRPVSLTAVVCKVFEKFIRNALCKHFIDNNLLSEEQFGFCQGRSCTTQLLVTLNEWMQSLDKKVPLDAAYLDFRKAFDSVPHKRLLTKLKGYGVTGKVLDWVQDFLSNRNQFVCINGKSSNKAPVTSGVPQGSVLGPTLFIYFINDLPEVARSLVKIFADDTKAYCSIRTETDHITLQDTINSFVEWSDIWLLRFNSDKCKVLHLGSNNPRHEYEIKNGDVTSKLETTNNEKDLGVFIDENLTFNHHLNTAVKKARSMAGMLQRHITYKVKGTMIPLFKALVRPVLEYAVSVWCPYMKKDIEKMEKVQQQFTKRVKGMSDLSYTGRLAKLKLPSLIYRRIRGDMIEVYKILNNYYDPVTTKSLLTLNNNSHSTRTNSMKLEKPSFNKQKYQMFFTNRVINLWNRLPQETVKSKTLNAFKNNIDANLKHYWYKCDIDITKMRPNFK